jgi:hypothetical protein
LLSLKKNIALLVVVYSGAVLAQNDGKQACTSSKPKTLPFGVVKRVHCDWSANGHSEALVLNEKTIIKDQQLFDNESNKDRSIRIYTSGDFDIGTGCSRRIYLVDLSLQPVKVIAFGVKNACNEFHWASWGDKRSVIALKSNVKFTYENGKLTPPAAGEKLFKAIEPPHSSRGAGLTEESAIPFVNEVELPK